jgi:Leucine-rich repeat (LRR) protein
MTNLKELDLRNCSIIVLQIDYFYNLPYLDKLFLSHNHIIQIETEAFLPLINLRHLDLSYNEIIDFEFLLGGLILEEDIFENLQRLMFLDLSHTTLHNSSVKALKKMKSEMEQLSLCYTGITNIEADTFYNKSLKVVDLSGNQKLHDNLNAQNLRGLENSLEILIYRNASIENFGIFKSLKKLRMLDLRQNLIEKLTSKNFSTFPELEILDLGDNFIHDWSERIFHANKKLKVLNLRANNINFMKEQMLKDFYETR